TYHNDVVKVYVNDTLKTTTNTTFTGLGSSSSGLYIGSRFNASPLDADAYYYKGYIDDLRIYNRELTREEISDYHAEMRILAINDEPCPGGQFNTACKTIGLYNTTNIFTAELSDAAGSFVTAAP